jgi:phosphocarrier protein
MGLLNRKAGTDRTDKCEKEVTIVNRLGMHARPAAMFVKTASRFRCEVWVEKDGDQINGKSIMGLMLLAAGKGSKLTIRCSGSDCEQALKELEQLIAGKFNED